MGSNGSHPTADDIPEQSRHALVYLVTVLQAGRIVDIHSICKVAIIVMLSKSSGIRTKVTVIVAFLLKPCRVKQQWKAVDLCKPTLPPEVIPHIGWFSSFGLGFDFIENKLLRKKPARDAATIIGFCRLDEVVPCLGLGMFCCECSEYECFVTIPIFINH